MIKNISHARYEARVMKLMQERQGEKYNLMQAFNKQSNSFAALREQVVTQYFKQKQLGVVFCVDALVLLVDRVLETMEQDINTTVAA